MGQKINKIAITFDVDMVDYIDSSNSILDEMDICFPSIKNTIEKFESVKTTWFIRIDSQIEQIHRDSRYIFHKHADKINWLLNNGHEIGWHHHAYKKNK